MNFISYKEILTALKVIVTFNWKDKDTRDEAVGLVVESLKKNTDLADNSSLWTLKWYFDAKWGDKNTKNDVLDILLELLDEDPTHIDLDQLPNENAEKIDPVEVPATVEGKFKVALAVGHNKFTGARSHEGDDEWTTRNEVTKRAAEILKSKGVTTKIFYRDKSLSYGSAMRKHGRDIDAFGADIAIEVHFNSASASAKGMEMIAISQNSAKVFKPFVSKFHEHYPSVPIRHGDGIKLLSSGGRGAGFCRAPKCPAGVWEPCFASNPAEWDKFDDKYDKEAEAMADAIIASLNNL